MALYFQICQLPSILTFTALRPLSSIFSEEAATFGAGLGEGFKTGGECTIRVITTAIESAFLFAHLLYQLTAAIRALNTNPDLKGFSVFTLRVTTTGYKFPKAPKFDY